MMKNKDSIQTPLRYPGSKFRAYKYYESIIQSIEHDEYREPFFGSGAVFYQKNLSTYNWVNDLDEDLMNFYKVIQNKDDALKLSQKVKDVVPSKDYFENLKQKKYTTKFKKAFRYFVINRTAYSGIMNLPNWGFHKIKSVQPDKWPKRILDASNKLQNVKITSIDYEKLLFEPAKGKSVLLFIDPPYFAADQKRAYVKSFEKKDHIRLLENLKKTPHKFILTYDDCPELRDLYSWAYIYPIEFMYHTANANVTTRKKGKELIITNFKIVE